MMEHIIRSSSRPGDVVADFFMGSGSTIKEALKLGRKAIGVEIEEERYLQTVEEVKEVVKKKIVEVTYITRLWRVFYWCRPGDSFALFRNELDGVSFAHSLRK